MGKITVYTVSTDDAEKLSNDYCEKAFPKRYERANRFMQHTDRLRSIGAGALIDTVLGVSESDISVNKNGKPYTNGVEFNLSHSGQYAVLVKSQRPIGIDIESIDEKNMRVYKRVFADDEIAWLNCNLTRFHVLWTMKEAYLKATGNGLSVDLRSVSVMPMINGEALNGYYGVWTELSGHIISVCSTERFDGIEIKKLPEREAL